MKSLRSFRRAAIWNSGLLGLVLLTAPNLKAQTEIEASWIDSFARYSTATNWSTGTVPNNDSSYAYDVVIDQESVISDQDATINCLRIGSNGTLVDHGPGVSFRGTITASTMTNEGSVGYLFAALNVVGNFINSGALALSQGARASVGNTHNSESMSSSSFGGFIEVNGTLTNSGTVSTGLALSISEDLVNTGTVSTDINGSNRIAGNVYNNGTYNRGMRDAISGIVQNQGIMSTYRTRFNGPSIASPENDGVLRIGSRFYVGEISNPGTIDIGGPVTARLFEQGNAGIWQENSGPLGFGTVAVTDHISLDGTLDLSLLANVPLVLGQSFDLATFPPGNLIGSFSTVQGNSFSNGQLMFQISYDQNVGRIRLTVIAAGS